MAKEVGEDVSVERGEATLRDGERGGPQPTLSGGPEVVTTKKRLRKENFLVSLV